MKRSFLQLVAIVVAMVALLCVISFLQKRMNGLRTTYHLTDNTPLENAPPVVAFTSVALGGFRGILADYLWLRSGRMQEEGKYYEMVQLADWIVKLQPRFTGAHAFLGWNMAYNVSVTFTNFEDRWRWVKRGLELIRDEALEYNPGDPDLFRQLGWIFQHKMGQDSDDANRYYKVEWAKEMIRLFGDYYLQWETLDRAPLNETKLLAVLGDRAGEYRRILQEGQADFARLELEFREAATIPARFREAFDQAGITQDVELCLRHRWMVYKYRLDPKYMIRLNEIFGEFDWRLPEAHAVYWAQKGMEVWKDPSAAFKRLSCNRMIFQALNASFSTGRLLYLKGDLKNLQMQPNFKVADAANQAYLDAIRDFPNNNIQGAYSNFLVDAVVRFYIFGYKKKAANWFAMAKNYNETRFPRGMSLEDFVKKELAEDLIDASHRAAEQAINSYLFQAYTILAYAESEEADEYLSFESLTLTAKEIYDTYAKAAEGTELRRGMPPFDQMRRTALGVVGRMLQANPDTRRLAENLASFQQVPLERFIPRAEEIEAPKVK